MDANDPQSFASLQLEVLDENPISDDAMGNNMIVLAEVDEWGRKVLPLSLDDETDGRGTVTVILRRETAAARTARLRYVTISVDRCSKLVNDETLGLSDPYIKVSLKPVLEGCDSEFQTATCDDNLNPIFGEIFETECYEHNLLVGANEGRLTFDVYDEDPISDDIMCSFSAGISQVSHQAH